MDQHPIPQNVTGFQFKLIGSMTVKQFGYVAVGVVTAIITYYLPIGGAFGVLLKIFLIPLLGASGAIIAFVPVDGRPIDVMAGNFLKALFNPNQYVYRKQVKKFSFLTVQVSKAPLEHTKSSQQPLNAAAEQKNRELQQLLRQSSESKVKNAQDEHEAAFLKSLSQTPSIKMTAAPLPKASPVQTLPPLPPVKKTPLPPTPPPAQQATPSQGITQQEASLEQQIAAAKQQEAATHDTKQVAILHQKTVDLEKQLDTIRAQKQILEQEITSLKGQLMAQKTKVTISEAASPTPAPAPKREEVKSAAHVRSVPKELNKKMGLLVSDTPNVVAGVVKDPRGNVLPNILVEIKDKADNPVRAFKTNALGNFASATPLPAGNYTITLEDPKGQNTFDAIQITANDQVMLPIEIISYDKREQLRKDLFS